MTDDPLIDVAAAVADGTAVDWGSASRTLESDDRDLLDGLKLIAEIAETRRGSNATPGAASGGPDRPLEHWGPLRILERVGRGTFGDVYRAWDTRLDREVALKILHRPPEEGSSASTVIDEGRLLARVRHPNIVTVYGADRIDDRVGMWMEVVHGKTLESELAEHGRVEAGRVVEIGVTLADALAAVHRAGLLHRDVKAQNVMRDRDGRLLLTDFGAGELFDVDGVDGGHRERSVGTPLYAAPEVLAGDAATRQSDVYSLGVLLYRLATGGYPVQGRTLGEVRDAHARGSRSSIRVQRPDLPEALAAVIEHAIDPDPARRCDSADALHTALSGIARQRAVLSSDPPAPTTWSSLVGAAFRRPGPVGRRLVLPAVVLALSGAVGLLLWERPEPFSIAVLPLENLGTDPESEQFADGLTDELIRHLAMIQGLDVRSRASSFMFKSQPRDVREAGRQLKASLLLAGSLLRSDQRIRINVQLVRASDDATVWAGKFDRDINDILEIQDEISHAIVNELRLTLDQPNQRHYDIDIGTYEQYLRARSLSERKDRQSLRTAIAFYKEVVTSAPGYAPAHAGLADAYADLEFWGVNYQDTYAQVKAAASKAIELDPALPEAYAAMGLVYARDRDWARAGQAFRRSIAINPNLSRTRTAYAHWYLFQSGRLDEALQELRLALQHDPLSLDIRRVMTHVQVSAGQYSQALDTSGYVLRVDPKYPLISLVRARALHLSGNSADALRLLEAMPPNRAPELGYVYAVLGRHDEAEALAAGAAGAPLTQAVIYAGLADKDRAFAALDAAAMAGDPKIGATLTYPELAVLRDDPRFEAFRRRLGLAP